MALGLSHGIWKSFGVALPGAPHPLGMCDNLGEDICVKKRWPCYMTYFLSYLVAIANPSKFFLSEEGKELVAQ